MPSPSSPVSSGPSATTSRFGDGLGLDTDLVTAAESAVSQALSPLAGQPADLLCAFVSGADPDDVQAAGVRAMEISGAGATLGCSAGGVIGANRGVERASAVSAFAASLPGVRTTPFQLDAVQTPDGVAVTGMPHPREDDAVALVLADPSAFPADVFVHRTNTERPGLPLLGGLAGGARGPGSVRLFGGGRRAEAGAVGVLLSGPVTARPLVSQGCRPVGPSMAVTAAEDNTIHALAGMPALSKLEQILGALPVDEQRTVAQGLQIGLAMDEYAAEHERGDFLIRPVVGADRDRGSLTVGSAVHLGQTVRFQVRDAEAADEDLADLFARIRADTGPVEGALLFSCNGRGSAMFPDADHDVRAVRAGLGAVGVGGFFAAGEIGPVAGRNHLHGFTASMLAFLGPR